MRTLTLASVAVLVLSTAASAISVTQVAELKTRELARLLLSAAAAPGASKCSKKWSAAYVAKKDLVLRCEGGGEVRYAPKRRDGFSFDAQGKLVCDIEAERDASPYIDSQYADALDLVNKAYFADKDAAARGAARLGLEIPRAEAWGALVKALAETFKANKRIPNCSFETMGAPFSVSKEGEMHLACASAKPGGEEQTMDLKLPSGVSAVNAHGVVVVVNTLGEPGAVAELDPDHSALLVQQAISIAREDKAFLAQTKKAPAKK